MPQRTSLYDDRRRKKDGITKAIPFISGFGWLTTIVMFFFLDRAAPEDASFFSQFAVEATHSGWNRDLLRVALAVLVAAFLLCLVGIVFNAMRLKRKTDRFNVPIIVLEICTGIGIGAFLYGFGSYLF